MHSVRLIILVTTLWFAAQSHGDTRGRSSGEKAPHAIRVVPRHSRTIKAKRRRLGPERDASRSAGTAATGGAEARAKVEHHDPLRQRTLFTAPKPAAETQRPSQKTKRAITERPFSFQELHVKFGLADQRFPEMFSSKGRSFKRAAYGGKEASSLRYQESISRLFQLDPNQKLLSPAEWKTLKELHQVHTFQISNSSERLEMVLTDPNRRVHDTRILEEKARGKLATILVEKLKGKKPQPESLFRAAQKLAKEHPFLKNPYRVEQLIADMGGLFPELAKWDFRSDRPQVERHAQLDSKTMRRALKEIGYRAYADANVLFSGHMYEDALPLLDAMTALGLKTSRTRFVATPYPFEKQVQEALERRGTRAEHTPYSVEQTKANIEQGIRELMKESDRNGSPIVVFDDGGLASQIIAEKFSDQLHRFRIVEITKSGERVAKKNLAPMFGLHRDAMGFLNRDLQKGVHEKYIAMHSYDNESRAVAEKRWNRLMEYVRMPNMRDTQKHAQAALAEHLVGFAYYMYSNAKFKREQMSPLYARRVLDSALLLLREGKKKLRNKRITLIGGGAMGISAAEILRKSGHDVTFAESNDTTRDALRKQGYEVSDLEDALGGRGMIIDMTGEFNLISPENIFLIDDHTHIISGSSKQNPIDMASFEQLHVEKTNWAPNKRGQKSTTMVFEAAGMKRTIHFPGNGWAVNHNGERQGVPMEAFMPEIVTLLRLGVHAMEQRPQTHFPFFGTPEHIQTSARNVD